MCFRPLQVDIQVESFRFVEKLLQNDVFLIVSLPVFVLKEVSKTFNAASETCILVSETSILVSKTFWYPKPSFWYPKASFWYPKPSSWYPKSAFWYRKPSSWDPKPSFCYLKRSFWHPNPVPLAPVPRQDQQAQRLVRQNCTHCATSSEL